MVNHLVANGWLLGKSENYNRELALYPEDLLGFVQDTQEAQWQKFCALYPNNPQETFLARVATQLNKADPNAANKEMRTFGTLGVLRHGLRDRGTRFSFELMNNLTAIYNSTISKGQAKRKIKGWMRQVKNKGVTCSIPSPIN